MDNFSIARTKSLLPESIFQNVFILESRDQWTQIAKIYNPKKDLVLTYDFGLSLEINKVNGKVFYVDHLCTQEEMEKNNFLIYDFFGKWYLNKSGDDLFTYEGINYGNIFSIHIWNDLTFYARTRLCLSKLRSIKYETLRVAKSLDVVSSVLSDMHIEFEKIEISNTNKFQKYYFPIHRWMDERLRSYGFRQIVRDIITTIHGILMGTLDRITESIFPKKRIFIQEYHPTRRLLFELQRMSKFRVLQGHFSLKKNLLNVFRDRPIPIYGRISNNINLANNYLLLFKKNRVNNLVLSSGDDISEEIFRLIEKRLIAILPETLRNFKSVIRYLHLHPVNLVVLIGNIGHIAMLVDCVAKSKGIPRYLIINGLMLANYLDEGKDATFINSYSQSIRDNYFKDMKNIVCLGDPRMDQYVDKNKRKINRLNPVITIGASGFSNIDLNSYLAVEFEFLNDVLSAIQNKYKLQKSPKLILKVRANGYSALYLDFIKEYYPELTFKVDDTSSLSEIFEETDLYISIFSQSLIEASTLGIPVIYHKNDVQILHPPFDGNSELVTTFNSHDLELALNNFETNHPMFDAFMSEAVLEKYIGHLDGGNLQRNINFIEGLLINK